MITFGVPTKSRNQKVEKYPDTPVLTVDAASEKGKGSKFYLNPKAVELLGLQLDGTEQVSLAINEVEGVQHLKLAVTTNIDVPKYRVTKTGTFSNKKFQTYMFKTMLLDSSIQNEFKFTDTTEDNGVILYNLEQIGLPF